MRKSIAGILIVIILINIIIPNFIYAKSKDQGTYEDVQKHQSESGQSSTDQAIYDAQSTVTPDSNQKRTEGIGETDSSSHVVINALCYFLLTFPKAINAIMTVMVFQGGNSNVGEAANAVEDKDFTIEDLVLGKYNFFDINFFNYSGNAGEGDVNATIKKQVIQWYYVLRNISMFISLLILIYIGIRMAISTVAADKAKYKKMFIAWVTSFILLFTMQYIVLFLLSLQEWLVSIISGFAVGEGFEERIIRDTLNTMNNTSAWNLVPLTILYYILVYYQIKFFLMYFKRFLSVGFLFVISPLVTITYPIDKAGDGKAQAYSAWLTRNDLQHFYSGNTCDYICNIYYISSRNSSKGTFCRCITFNDIIKNRENSKNNILIKRRGIRRREDTR